MYGSMHTLLNFVACRVMHGCYMYDLASNDKSNVYTHAHM